MWRTLTDLRRSLPYNTLIMSTHRNRQKTSKEQAKNIYIVKVISQKSSVLWPGGARKCF